MWSKNFCKYSRFDLKNIPLSKTFGGRSKSPLGGSDGLLQGFSIENHALLFFDMNKIAQNSFFLWKYPSPIVITAAPQNIVINLLIKLKKSL